MLKTPLCDLLGIEKPVFQGGMAWVAEHKLAAAVSNAGGLGIIGAASAPPEVVREEIRKCKELTDKPFGVNIMLMHPQADEFAKIVVEEGVPVVTTGAGNPGKYIPAWKAAGIKVIPVVAAAVLAKHLEPLGIDAVIAEGTESGGHVGEMTTMALVPQVVDAVDLPVIAAGGIADGRQLAAALALGACGVQVGTCLLVSEECPIHENYKAALLKAKDSDTIVTGRSVGAPVRVLKNRMSREYVRQENAGADKMELEKYTLGSLRRAVFEGDTTTGSLMAGQVAGMLHEVRPVADILADLWNGGRQRIAALSGDAGSIENGTVFITNQDATRIIRLSPEEFLFSRTVLGEEYTIYCGEAQLIGAIGRACTDHPVGVYFLTGHGELTQEDCSLLALQLRSNGFEVHSGEIARIAPAATDILLLLAPRSDLTGADKFV